LNARFKLIILPHPYVGMLQVLSSL
jgi:hypothetical protein